MGHATPTSPVEILPKTNSNGPRTALPAPCLERERGEAIRDVFVVVDVTCCKGALDFWFFKNSHAAPLTKGEWLVYPASHSVMFRTVDKTIDF